MSFFMSERGYIINSKNAGPLYDRKYIWAVYTMTQLPEILVFFNRKQITWLRLFETLSLLPENSLGSRLISESKTDVMACMKSQNCDKLQSVVVAAKTGAVLIQDRTIFETRLFGKCETHLCNE